METSLACGRGLGELRRVPFEVELEQLALDRQEAGASIEITSRTVVTLDSDPEQGCPPLDRVLLRVIEQEVADAHTLVPGRDQQLVDDHNAGAGLAAHGDISHWAVVAATKTRSWCRASRTRGASQPRSPANATSASSKSKPRSAGEHGALSSLVVMLRP